MSVPPLLDPLTLRVIARGCIANRQSTIFLCRLRQMSVTAAPFAGHFVFRVRLTSVSERGWRLCLYSADAASTEDKVVMAIMARHSPTAPPVKCSTAVELFPSKSHLLVSKEIDDDDASGVLGICKTGAVEK